MSFPDRSPKNEAVRLLLAQRLHSLMLDVTKLRLPVPVLFDSMQNFCHRSMMSMDDLRGNGDMRDGCTITHIHGGKPLHIVLYNREQANPRRRAFTLAHELGHICLGHEEDGDVQEGQANRFASELLIPSVLVWSLRCRQPDITPEELCQVFCVSPRTAALRLDKLPRNPVFGADEQRLLSRCQGLLPTVEGPIVDI